MIEAGEHMFLTVCEQEAFLEKYNISRERFKESMLTWEMLDELAVQYEQEKNEHIPVVKKYSEHLQQCSYVHSLRYRIKDTEHLIEKVIRKNPEYMRSGDMITVSNYKDKITDLMGLRILLLFKEDWIGVHDYIMEYYGNSFNEDPFVYIRKGDNSELYDGRVRIENNRTYRSVHYVLRDACGACVEIQVRTLNEEAWSEVDHKLCYPYNMKNEMLNSYMDIMGQMTGMNDDMGTFMHRYIERFEDARQKGVLNSNEVYDYILSEIRSCQDEELRRRIENKIKDANDFRELGSFAELASSIMKKLDTE